MLFGKMTSDIMTFAQKTCNIMNYGTKTCSTLTFLGNDILRSFLGFNAECQYVKCNWTKCFAPNIILENDHGQQKCLNTKCNYSKWHCADCLVAKCQCINVILSCQKLSCQVLLGQMLLSQMQ